MTWCFVTSFPVVRLVCMCYFGVRVSHVLSHERVHVGFCVQDFGINLTMEQVNSVIAMFDPEADWEIEIE